MFVFTAHIYIKPREIFVAKGNKQNRRRILVAQPLVQHLIFVVVLIYVVRHLRTHGYKLLACERHVIYVLRLDLWKILMAMI